MWETFEQKGKRGRPTDGIFVTIYDHGGVCRLSVQALRFFENLDGPLTPPRVILMYEPMDLQIAISLARTIEQVAVSYPLTRHKTLSFRAFKKRFGFTLPNGRLCCEIVEEMLIIKLKSTCKGDKQNDD